MSFLAPVAAVLGLTIPAILALYFLKIRRPPRLIPAIDLWPKTVRDRQATVPWQRLRLSWLLALQLLLAATLVLAAMQPAVRAGTGLARDTIVLLDISASMQATDVPPSRLGEAKREVSQLIDQLGPNNRMTLITVGPNPQVVASASDPGTLRRVLDEVQASNGPGDLSQALDLAAGLVRPGDDARAFLFSDGILEPLDGSVADLPFPLEYHRIGASGENLGITSLAVSRQGATATAFAHVVNFGQEPSQATLEWRADGRLVDVRALTFGAGQSQDIPFSVPAGTAVVAARLNGGDAFPIDDSAVAVARSPIQLPVLLVTPGNLFLQQALRLRSDFQVTTVAPAAYRPLPGYALIVFDRFLPASLPQGPMLVIDPPAGSALSGGRPVGIGLVQASDASDPLLANVDLHEVHVALSQDLRGSTFGRPLVTSVQTPLVLVRENPFRQVLFGFDLHQSDLPLRVAFPILMENITEWMLPPSVPAHSFGPDEPVNIVPEAGAQSITVTTPAGNRLRLNPGSISTFGDTDQLGLYTVSQRIGSTTHQSWFTVNLFSDQISQLRPVNRLTLPPSVRPATSNQSHPGTLDLWPILALLGLGLLVAEWTAFHRGL